MGLKQIPGGSRKVVTDSGGLHASLALKGQHYQVTFYCTKVSADKNHPRLKLQKLTRSLPPAARYLLRLALVLRGGLGVLVETI